MPGCRAVPVLCASSGKGSGLEELWSMIEALPQRAVTPADNDHGLLWAAQRLMAERYAQDVERVEPLLARWRAGNLGDDDAADQLLRILSDVRAPE